MLRAKFGKDYIRKELAKQRQAIVSNLASIAAKEGEKFLAEARSSINIDTGAFPQGDFTDRTGNLRSSIGYAVLIDGEVSVSRIPNSTEGISAFTNILESLPWAKGIVFVGLAAMKYASYLEAMGYNVISSQWDVAMVDLTAALKKYEAMANKGLLRTEINIIDKLK